MRKLALLLSVAIFALSCFTAVAEEKRCSSLIPELEEYLKTKPAVFSDSFKYVENGETLSVFIEVKDEKLELTVEIKNKSGLFQGNTYNLLLTERGKPNGGTIDFQAPEEGWIQFKKRGPIESVFVKKKAFIKKPFPEKIGKDFARIYELCGELLNPLKRHKSCEKFRELREICEPLAKERLELTEKEMETG